MKKIFLLLFVTLSLFAYQAPMTVKGSKTVNSTIAFDLHKKGVVFIDVRPARFIKDGIIKDAKHVYVEDLTKEKLNSLVKVDEAVVFYCNGPGCSLSAEAIIKAVSYGYKKIYYYRDGFPGWVYYQLPVDK